MSILNTSIISTSTWIIIIVGVVLFGGIFLFSSGNKTKKIRKNCGNDAATPLMIQACERMVLYLERIRFDVLVKRVYMPGMTRSDLQFALIQSIQEEFEHNLAQRLYVKEETWFVIVMAKDEALKIINMTFGENAEADAAVMAQILASVQNPLIDRAIIAIKKEFNEF